MTDEILVLNQRLLDCISGGDWATYTELCHEDLTCFEPESKGLLVEGLAFHKHYFDNGSSGSARQETMVDPRVTMLGSDVALLCYVRLVQRQDSDGTHVTDQFSETRIWKRIDGAWKHVHFHRSK